MSKVSTVICAINYCDLLEETLLQNTQSLSDISIITDLKDKTTKELCQKFNVKCYQTDLFYINNSKFNRGMVLNAFFNQFKNELDWVLLLDADIVVPKDFEKLFFELNPDINSMYGSRRYNVERYEEWNEIKKDINNLKKHTLFRGVGYGYFQLFNFKSEIIKNLSLNDNVIIYPPYPTVSEGDWRFRNYWSDWVFDPPLSDDPDQHNIKDKDRPSDPKLLKQLPFHVIHLGQTGKNESSRVTSLFN